MNNNIEPVKSFELVVGMYAMKEISQELDPRVKRLGGLTKRGMQFSIRNLGASLVSVGHKMERLGQVSH